MKAYPNGIGETTGDQLVTAKPFYTTGDVWYVLFSAGTDGAGLGKQRLAPLKTLSQALTNAADGDDIVLLAGHAETIAATLTLSKKVRISGSGAGTGSMPQLTRSIAANGQLFNITTNRVELRNIYFPASGTLSTGAKVTMGGTDCLIQGCQFDSGANDTGPAVDIVTSGDRARINTTTFLSASTTAQPSMGLRISNAVADIFMNGAVFDGGTVGWSNAYALDATAAITTRFAWEQVALLRDSDIGINSSSTGFLTLSATSSSAKVVHA